jgi:hypothetical protein
MGDVKRWFVQAYRDGRLADAKALADWLDTEYPTMADDARNVVEVSFLYDLPWPPEPEAAGIKGLLPPALANRLTEMQDWRPSK